MKVPAQISFRNMKSSDSILSKLQERIDWLERFCNQIISCNVMIEKPHRHHQRGNLYHVRINLQVPGDQVVVSRGPSAHMAHKDVNVTIHDAFDEARRELEEYVRKRRGEIKHPPSENELAS